MIRKIKENAGVGGIGFLPVGFDHIIDFRQFGMPLPEKIPFTFDFCQFNQMLLIQYVHILNGCCTSQFRFCFLTFQNFGFAIVFFFPSGCVFRKLFFFFRLVRRCRMKIRFLVSEFCVQIIHFQPRRENLLTTEII